MSSRNLIDMIASGNVEAATDEFTKIVNSNIADNLEVRKVEVASTLFQEEEPVSEAMTDRQVTAAVGGDNKLRMALEKMKKHGINKLTRTERDRLLGMVPTVMSATQEKLPTPVSRKALSAASGQK